MGRRDPDFSADGIFMSEDMAAMAAAFRVACLKVGTLADQEEVRRAMALVVSQHYEMGIRQIDRIANSAARMGRVVASSQQGASCLL